MVKGCAKEKEGQEWIATSMMYKNIDIFKEVEINLENDWGWWKIAKWDCGIYWKVKVMFKLVITNNIKCGYICDCEAHTVEKMPIPMKNFNSRTTREKSNIYLQLFTWATPKRVVRNT